MDGWTYEWIDDGWKDGWIIDGRKDRHEGKDGWTDRQTYEERWMEKRMEG